MFQELSSDLLIFIYFTFEFKICLCYKPYKLSTEIISRVFLQRVSGFQVDVRLLGRHVAAVFGEIFMPSV